MDAILDQSFWGNLETRRVYKKIPDNSISKAVSYNSKQMNTEQKSFPSGIHCGDVFAIKDNEKYRIFALTEEKEMYFCTAIFGYAWRNIYDEIPSYGQLYVIGKGINKG